MIVFFWLCVGVVLYTYFAYPLLIAALAMGRRRKQAKIALREGHVSVVLVVRNEASRVAARIRNLIEQQPAGIVGEIVVVSDGSDDATDEVVSGLALADPRIHLVRQSVPKGKAAGLNLGIGVARNDVLVFADARQTFQVDAVARLYARFADEEVGAVAGELRFLSAAGANDVAETVGLYWRYEVWIRSNEAQVDSVIGCPGSIYAARRELVRPLPEGLLLDDVWVPMHVVMQGKRVVYEKRAIAEDHPSDDLDREFGRKARTLGGSIQLVLAQPRLVSPVHNRLWWMFLSHKLMRLVVPYAMAGALISNLAMPGYGLGIVIAGQCLFYGLGLLGFLAGGQSVFWRLCGAVKVFLSINAAAVLGSVYALTGRSHALWRRPTRG